jgi:hypothetical protein
MTSVPGDLARFLGPGRVTALESGGSGALILRHDHLDTARFVKFLPHRADAVDGHESHVLLVKAEQVRLIHDTAAGLQDAVPLVDVTEITDGYVLTSPIIDGRSPIETLLAGDAPAFAATLNRLLDMLGESGYSCRSSIADETSDPYIGRARRRLDYLGKHATGWSHSDLAWTAESIVRVAYKHGLLPTRFYFPAHGDLNLFNVIETDRGALIMVDQRGVLDDWDPLYDIGKMLITLWIQAGLEHGFYRLGHDGHDLTCRKVTASLLCRGTQALREAVSAWEFGEQIERSPKRRWIRVLFAAAVHAICEAACRVSVSMSDICANPAYEIAKAHVYLDLGGRLLRSLEHESIPQLPMPRVAG